MRSIFKEFREFALKGNAVDMAIGIIIGPPFDLLHQSEQRQPRRLDKCRKPRRLDKCRNGVFLERLYLHLPARVFSELRTPYAIGFR
jgi:hypothetical protein